jgi:STE24 endopeptidase
LKLLRLAYLPVLAAAWALAAYLLWQSKVPSSLHLPHLDEHTYFARPQLHTASTFSHFADLMWWCGTIVELLGLAVYARYGARWTRESAAGPIGTGMLLGMLGFALVWLLELPFGLLTLWWERRHHLSRVGYATYVFGGWLALAGTALFLCVALAVVIGLARFAPRRWWIAAAPAFVGLTLLFAFVSPYLVGASRLRDPRLRAIAARLERAEGVVRVPVDVQTMHDTTSLPNAEAMGIGPSRRIVLWDTLLDGRFGTRELAFVLAHEIGHLARNHIWKDVGWYALFAFPGTFLLARAAGRLGGMRNPEAVPLTLLVLVVLGLLALPLQNAISRHMEAEADWMALRTTHDPSAAVALFRRFQSTTLEEPNPSTWDYLLLENHPTLMQRIEMARAYATSAAQSP